MTQDMMVPGNTPATLLFIDDEANILSATSRCIMSDASVKAADSFCSASSRNRIGDVTL